MHIGHGQTDLLSFYITITKIKHNFVTSRVEIKTTTMRNIL